MSSTSTMPVNRTNHHCRARTYAAMDTMTRATGVSINTTSPTCTASVPNRASGAHSSRASPTTSRTVVACVPRESTPPSVSSSPPVVSPFTASSTA